MSKPVQVRALSIFDVIAEHQQKVARDEARAKVHTYADALKHCTKLADGKSLVIYAPHRDDVNEHLCVVEKVTMALKRNGEIRFIVDDSDHGGIEGGHYVCKGGFVCFEGFLSHKTIDAAKLAPEGTEFRGWKKTKQYKLTSAEIHALLHGIVWEQG